MFLWACRPLPPYNCAPLSAANGTTPITPVHDATVISLQSLRDALALPVEARGAPIDSLIDSLDNAVDDGAEEAWRDEIHRRLQQIDSGEPFSSYRGRTPAGASGLGWSSEMARSVEVTPT
jgi:Putative addiction module component